jgi:hypothetical protein
MLHRGFIKAYTPSVGAEGVCTTVGGFPYCIAIKTYMPIIIDMLQT